MMVFMLSLIGMGALVVAWQVYDFLYSGVWHSVSILSAFIYFMGTKNNNWLLYPETWQGLHAVLDWTPLSLALVVFAFIAASSDG